MLHKGQKSIFPWERKELGSLSHRPLFEMSPLTVNSSCFLLPYQKLSGGILILGVQLLVSLKRILFYVWHEEVGTGGFKCLLYT